MSIIFSKCFRSNYMLKFKENFPFDIQELNLIISSKYNSKIVNLISNPNKISTIHPLATFTFIDQQKWYIFL